MTSTFKWNIIAHVFMWTLLIVSLDFVVASTLARNGRAGERRSLIMGRGGPRGRCPVILDKLNNGRVRIKARGFTATFRCNPHYQLVGSSTATCVRNRWTNPLPICITTGCDKVNNPHNGKYVELFNGAMLKFECHPGYQLKGNERIHCEGLSWSDSPPTCEVGNQEISLKCDFEKSNCGWQTDNSSSLVWKQNALSTTKSTDHYLYLFQLSKHIPGTKARLYSPVFQSNYSGSCLIFNYRLRNYGLGHMNVLLKPESRVVQDIKPFVLQLGNQSNKWMQASVLVPKLEERFQIILEANYDNNSGNINLDDLQLVPNTNEDSICQNLSRSIQKVSSLDGDNSNNNTGEVSGTAATASIEPTATSPSSSEGCQGGNCNETRTTKIGDSVSPPALNQTDHFCNCSPGCNQTDSCCSNPSIYCTNQESSHPLPQVSTTTVKANIKVNASNGGSNKEEEAAATTVATEKAAKASTQSVTLPLSTMATNKPISTAKNSSGGLFDFMVNKSEEIWKDIQTIPPTLVNITNSFDIERNVFHHPSSTTPSGKENSLDHSESSTKSSRLTPSSIGHSIQNGTISQRDDFAKSTTPSITSSSSRVDNGTKDDKSGSDKAIVGTVFTTIKPNSSTSFRFIHFKANASSVFPSTTAASPVVSSSLTDGMKPLYSTNKTLPMSTTKDISTATTATSTTKTTMIIKLSTSSERQPSTVAGSTVTSRPTQSPSVKETTVRARAPVTVSRVSIKELIQGSKVSSVKTPEEESSQKSIKDLLFSNNDKSSAKSGTKGSDNNNVLRWSSSSSSSLDRGLNEGSSSLSSLHSTLDGIKVPSSEERNLEPSESSKFKSGLSLFFVLLTLSTILFTTIYFLRKERKRHSGERSNSEDSEMRFLTSH